MMIAYDIADGVLVRRDAASSIGDKTVWVDLLNPTREEDLLVERCFAISVPTREEMQEIEASSRIYQERNGHYMTAVVLHQKEFEPKPNQTPQERRQARLGDVPIATPVTFVLAGDRLVTVRYEEPRAFAIFLGRNQKGDLPCTNACSVLVGLLESIVDREADRVERIQSEVDTLGHHIFGIHGETHTKNKRFDIAVKTIGREGELTSRSRESLATLDRILTYMQLVLSGRNEDKQLRARIKSAGRDVEGLNDQVHYLSNKVQLLLDATLGLIGLEQNNIIKLFSVVSVALMPPTLIASIYGMNFKHMPELDWQWGYPLAILMMIVSSILPFIYFKRKGWL